MIRLVFLSLYIVLIFLRWHLLRGGERWEEGGGGAVRAGQLGLRGCVCRGVDCFVIGWFGCVGGNSLLIG